jgi:hypothetical protein
MLRNGGAGKAGGRRKGGGGGGSMKRGKGSSTSTLDSWPCDTKEKVSSVNTVSLQ